MLLIAPENHCYFLPDDSRGWEFLYVSFHGSEAVRLAGECRRRSGVINDFSADSRTVPAAWEILRMCRCRQLISRYDASAAAYRFLMALLADTDRGKQGESDRFHRKVHEYCLEHLSEPLDVADLAGAAGCSRSHFSRRFRKEEGISPHEFPHRAEDAARGPAAADHYGVGPRKSPRSAGSTMSATSARCFAKCISSPRRISFRRRCGAFRRGGESGAVHPVEADQRMPIPAPRGATGRRRCSRCRSGGCARCPGAGRCIPATGRFESAARSRKRRRV